MKIRLNHQQAQFVIEAGDGFTCLGFDNCDRNVRQLADMLGDDHDIPDKGTLDQYLHYQALVDQARESGALRDRTWFDPETPGKIRRIIEEYRLSRRRIRLFYGDHETGRDWLEEHDVIGTIGRSTGPLKTPILLPQMNSSGGTAILTSCIVRMLDVATKREVYRHPNYREPNINMATSSTKGNMVDVLVDGSIQARFRSSAKAERWIAFMKGMRFSAN